MTKPTNQVIEPFDPRPFRTRPRVAVAVVAWCALIVVLGSIFGLGTEASAHGAKTPRPVTIEIPNEPEDATGQLADALIELGATATCRGECLRYVDANGQTVFVRFTP